MKKYKGKLRIRFNKTTGNLISPNWFGRYSIGGVRKEIALNEVKGILPPNGDISQLGDWEFEQSRAKALEKLETHLTTLATEKTMAERQRIERESAKQVGKIKYGIRPLSIPLSMLWETFSKRGNFKCKEQHKKHIQQIIKRFINYLKENFPTCQKFEDTTLEMVQGFCQKYKGTISARTYNEYLLYVKLAYLTLTEYQRDIIEYLKNEKQKTKTESRDLFSTIEITEIIDIASRVDNEVKSMVIVASCTGLRLKDICLLKWESINFADNLITLQTHKTDGNAIIGMWSLLREELLQLNKTANGNEYVFPDIAKQYKKDKGDNIINRLKFILKLLGYGSERKIPKFNTYSKEEIQKSVLDTLEKSNWSKIRKKKGKLFFEEFMKGQTIKEIADKFQIKKDNITNYLIDLEELTQCSIIRKNLLSNNGQNSLKKGEITASKKTDRKNAPNKRCWHSFRGSFIVNAIRAGVSIELITKVTGAEQVKIIYKHYIKIDKDFMYEGFTSKEPVFASLQSTEKKIIKTTPINERIRVAIDLLEQIKDEKSSPIIQKVIELLKD